jgi:hypothetical protein
VKDNVLPKRATAVINFRILPGDTPADCLAYIDRVPNTSRSSSSLSRSLVVFVLNPHEVCRR